MVSNLKELLHLTGKGIKRKITILSTEEVITNIKEYEVSFKSDLWRTSMQSLTATLKGQYDLSEEWVKVEMGVWEDGSISPSEEEITWYDFGEFLVMRDGFTYDDKTKETIIKNAFDKMILTHLEWVPSDIGVTFPATVKEVVEAICNLTGIESGTLTWINDDQVIEESKWHNNRLAYRNALDDIAQMCHATISIENNKLVIKPINDEVIDTIKEGKKSLDVKAYWGNVNILNLTREPQHDNYSYPPNWTEIPVNDRKELVFANNQIIDKRREELAPLLFNLVQGFGYSPFEYTGFGYLTMKFGDCVNVVDRDNNTHKSYITKGSWKVNTGFSEMLGSDFTSCAKEKYVLLTDQQREGIEIYLMVDQQSAMIQGLISDVSENSTEIGKLTLKSNQFIVDLSYVNNELIDLWQGIADVELTPGPPGNDGQSQYVFIRYSENENGNPMFVNPTENTKYIGIVNVNANVVPGHASFTWSKYQGKDGSDGTTTYTWVRYADTPTTGISSSPAGKKYIGLAFNKTTSSGTNTYADYQWYLMPQNMELGSRNLVLESDEVVISTSYLVKEYTIGTDFIEDQVYTVVLKGTKPSSQNFGIMQNNGNNGRGNLIHTGDDIYTLTFTSVAPTPGNENSFSIYQPPNDSNVGEVTIEWIKLVVGDTTSYDWAPAPEDLVKEINDLEGELQTQRTSFTQQLGGFQQSVDETYLKQTEFGTFEQSISTTIDTLASGMEISFQDVTDALGVISNNLTDEFQKLDKYIRFSEGNIELGDRDSDFKVIISNTQITFKEGVTTVAYISNNALIITEGSFFNQLQLGNPDTGVFAFTARDDGSLSFGKVR